MCSIARVLHMYHRNPTGVRESQKSPIQAQTRAPLQKRKLNDAADEQCGKVMS